VGGVWRFLADRLEHDLLELADNSEIDQRARNRELQSELLTDLGGELQDDVSKASAIAAFTASLLDGPAKLLIDHSLNAFKSSGCRKLLVDDVVGAFQSDD